MYDTKYVRMSDEERRLAEERIKKNEEIKAQIRAEQRRIIDEKEAERAAREAADREAREAPPRRVVEILKTRLGPDLPEFAAQFAKVDLGFVRKFLNETIATAAKSEQADDDAANRAHDQAVNTELRIRRDERELYARLGVHCE